MESGLYHRGPVWKGVSHTPGMIHMKAHLSSMPPQELGQPWTASPCTCPKDIACLTQVPSLSRDQRTHACYAVFYSPLTIRYSPYRTD